MLDSLSYEDYAKQVNTKFRLSEFDLEIDFFEISKKKTTSEQEMFSLYFRTPKDVFLEQRIYKMTHRILGEGEIFLVPIALDANGYCYEAGFNRLINQLIKDD